MNCSVCNRNNAVTLSICPSCGAMINDSVREELIGKISNAVKPLDFELKGTKMTQNKTAQQIPEDAPSKSAPTSKNGTTEISSKQTSQTLVEFHSKNTTIPEWRLQLQNVVRQRQERETTEPAVEIKPSASRAHLITSGANALKAETTVSEPKTAPHKNPTLTSALERIAKSRSQFLEEEKPEPEPAAQPAKTGKNFPFYIAGKTNDTATAKPAEINPPINSFAKPKLASSLRQEKLDTNKLPPLSKLTETPAKFETRIEISNDIKPEIEQAPKTEIKFVETAKTEVKVTKFTESEIKSSTVVQTIETPAVEAEECDDCAPFAMRFNAGLFDLIIGSFTSLILLAPFMLLGGNWLSTAGIFAFLATCAIVMFVYMTTAIGLYGRTFGMRLFSLELIDAETEDYPSLHQAAVNSAVYLLSLALAGIGFLTVPFNEDKRAVHDLVSGTIVVREE